MNNRRILVIDDEPIIRELMVEILEDDGYAVVSAPTAERALELLADEDVGLVISDIMMPGLSGLELLETLRAIRPSLPVLLVTGAGTYEHLHGALARGATGLVLKPFSHADIKNAVADALERNDRWERELRERMLTPSLASALANAIEMRDGPTHGHCERLAAVSVRIGEALGLEPNEIETLRLGAILHDVGKIGIPDSILLKRGPLDPQEEALMRTHPSIGDELLAPLDLLARARPIVLHHHEHWDGGGYPSALAGERIPLLARIVALADGFEAMASDRPYREPLTLDAIRVELQNGRGTQWDPRLVDVLLELIEAGVVVAAAEGARVTEAAARPHQATVFSVLLVEDNADHAALARAALEDVFDDVSVTHACDLSSASELLKGSLWSLAVVDYNLPDGTGLDAIDALRKHAPQMPILMLTGVDSTSVAVEAFRRGAADYVVKSNGYIADLQSRVRTLMEAA